MFCREQVAQLRSHEQELTGKGVALAAIGLGDMEHARRFRQETGIGFPLLVDERREAYRAVRLRTAPITHLLRRDNVAARRQAMAAGHRQHGLGAHPLQLGGAFVFGPGDVDLLVHVSETFSDRATVPELLAALP